MRRATYALILTPLLAGLAATPAFAACTSPAGVAGDQYYNASYNVMQFCNGTNWVNMGSSNASFVGALTANKWCTSDGTAINCTSDTPSGAAGSGGQVQYNGSSSALAGAAGLTYATSSDIVAVTALAATDKALIVKGAASQTANLMEFRNSSDTVLTSVSASGAVNIGSTLGVTGAVTGASFSGIGSGLTALNASNMGSGTVPTARLGSGTANSSTYLRGDNSWAAPTTSAGGSTTQVQFNASGTLSGDSNLVWDNTNKRLGIGTTSPGAKLDIRPIAYGNNQAGGMKLAAGTGEWPSGVYLRSNNSGVPRLGIDINSTEALSLQDGGNVGIGTVTPTIGAKLDVAGNIYDSAVAGDGQGVLGYASGTHIFSLTRQSNNLAVSAYDGIGFAPGATSGPSTSYAMYVKSGGNVGIGTNAPEAILSVYGTSSVNFNRLLNGGANGSHLLLRSARGTTSPSALQAGDMTGMVSFRGYDGSEWTVIGGATIASYAQSNWSGSDHSANLAFLTTPSGSADALTERMRITHDGKVGIGTTSPAQKLSVAGIVESTSGGFKFPDGTTQTSAGSGGGGVPSGAVMAFNLTACPSGWSEYTPARGRFIRGIDNGAGNDPDGTRSLGSTQEDELKSHSHSVSRAFSATVWAWTVTGGAAGYAVGGTTGTTASGGEETRPKNVALLYCQKN